MQDQSYPLPTALFEGIDLRSNFPYEPTADMDTRRLGQIELRQQFRNKYGKREMTIVLFPFAATKKTHLFLVRDEEEGDVANPPTVAFRK